MGDLSKDLYYAMMMGSQNPILPFSATDARPNVMPVLNTLYGTNNASGSPQVTRQSPQSSGGWTDYLGIGAQAVSPVASAILGRQKGQPPSISANSVSLGQKPMIPIENMYRRPMARNPILARILGG